MNTKKQPLIKHSLLASALIVSILGGGWAIYRLMNQPQYNSATTPADQQQQPVKSGVSPQQHVIDQHFNKALAYLSDNQHQLAVREWTRLLLINDSIPEAHANMGFSLYELESYDEAIESFELALALDSYQNNAYYGLAISYEKTGDIEAAAGAMRSFIHLAKGDDPFIRKGRSALWEWQSILEQSRAKKLTTESSQEENNERPETELEPFPVAQDSKPITEGSTD